MMVGSSTSTYNLVVQGKPIAGGHIECDRDFFEVTCCWWEDFGDYLSYVCQACDDDGENCGPIVNTDPRDLAEPPRTPGGGANVPQDGGVFEQPPVSPPRNDANVPQDGGVFEQPPVSPQQGQKSGLEDEASKGSVFEQRSMYTSPQIAPPTTSVDQENKTPSN